jgi:hypothetical protein
MMLDFEVQRCTRHCATTERELAAGEEFYSVLEAEGGDVVRRDYCAGAWEGPPEGALGWWKSHMPLPNQNKMNWAPNDVMLDLLERLEGDLQKQDMRYVLALLLIRRRVVRFEESEQPSADNEVFVLYCPKKETTYRVSVVAPTAQRADEIQEELAKLLFADAA